MICCYVPFLKPYVNVNQKTVLLYWYHTILNSQLVLYAWFLIHSIPLFQRQSKSDREERERERECGFVCGSFSSSLILSRSMCLLCSHNRTMNAFQWNNKIINFLCSFVSQAANWMLWRHHFFVSCWMNVTNQKPFNVKKWNMGWFSVFTEVKCLTSKILMLPPAKQISMNS